MTINTNLNKIIVDYNYILTEPCLRMNDTGNFQVVDQNIAIGRRHVVRPRKRRRSKNPGIAYTSTFLLLLLMIMIMTSTGCCFRDRMNQDWNS